MRVTRSLGQGAQYRQAVEAVIGPPRSGVQALAVLWAHEIAWSEAGGASLDELEQLAAVAAAYGVPLNAVLDEKRREDSNAPVVAAPARRPIQVSSPKPKIGARVRTIVPRPSTEP